MNNIIEKIRDLQIALLQETTHGEYDLIVDTRVYMLLRDHFFQQTCYMNEEMRKELGMSQMTINGPGGIVKIHENKKVEIDSITLDMEPF